MANRYRRSGAAANWGTAAAWELTPGGGESVAVPTSSDDVFFVSGSGDTTIAANAVAKSVTCTGWSGTLTHNSFSLTVSGNVVFSSTMTYTPASVSSVISIGTTGSMTSAGKLLWVFTANGATVTLNDDLNFVDRKNCVVQINGANGLNLNGNKIVGYSSTSRVLVRSQTLGTARTVTTSTAGSGFSNCDFRDINFANGGNDLDLSAITGLSGDCGGNGMSGGGTLTLTPSTTQTWTGAGGNWESVSWTSRMPLPQDTVVLSGTAGQTITTASIPRLGRDLSVTTGCNFTISGAAATIYGSIDFSNLNTFSQTANLTCETQRRTGTETLTSNGKTFSTSGITIAYANSTFKLNDALTCSGALTLSSASTGSTFDANDQNVTVRNFAAGSAIYTINLGSGTWVITSNDTTAGSNIFNVNSGSTVNSSTSTIVFTYVGANTKTFGGGGKSYYDFKFYGGGAGAVIFVGDNSFSTISMHPSGLGTATLTFTSTSTTTVNDMPLGNGTNVVTINASTGGSQATLAKSGGGIVTALDYCSITDIAGSPDLTWFYTSNSTVSNTTQFYLQVNITISPPTLELTLAFPIPAILITTPNTYWTCSTATGDVDTAQLYVDGVLVLEVDVV